MTTLREISARFKVDARGATKEIKKFDKEIDKAKVDLEAAEKAARKFAEASERGGKKEAAARRKANLALKDARKALRDLEKARKSEAAAARKAAAEQAKAAKASEKSFKDTKGNAKAAAASIANTAKAIVVGLAAATAGVVAFTKSWATSAAEIDRTARQFDVGRDELQKLSGAARLAGVDTDEVTDAIKEMRVRTAEALEDGITPTAEALQELGLHAKDLKGRDVIDSFQLIASRLKNVGEEADRTKILMEIFGEEAGVRMAPLLDGGAEGLQDLIDKFVGFGGIVDDEGIEKAKQFNIEWNETAIMLESFGRMIAEDIAPAVRELLKGLRDWLKANKGLQRQRINRLLKQILNIVKDLVPFFLKMAEAAVAVVEALGGVEQSLKILIGTIAVFKIATVGAFGPWAAAAVAFITLLDTIKTKQDNLDKSQDAAIRRAVSPTQITAADRARLSGTAEGERVAALEAVHARNVARIKDLGGDRGIAAGTRAVDRSRNISEVGGAEDAEAFRENERDRDEAIKLSKENKEISRRIAREIAGVQDQGPTAPGGFFDLDPGKLARFQELASIKRNQQGKLSKAQQAEFDQLRGELNVEEPEKVKDPKKPRKKKKKSKKEKEATIGELLGLPGGAGFKTIAETQPKGLGTVLNTFNITNQIGVPAFNVNIQAAPGSTMKGQANAVVAAMGDGASIIVRQAQRASIGQVLG